MIATHREMRGRWPAVVARAEGALAEFAADPRRLACKHIVSGEVFAALCAEHVAGGLRCARCAGRHTGRHSEEIESRCDSCQVSSRLLHSLLSLGEVVDLEVRDTRGCRRRIATMVAVDCLGVCPSCWTEAGMPAA